MRSAVHETGSWRGSRTASWLSRGASWLVAAWLSCISPSPSCPCNELQEAARQAVRLALHIGEPAKCPKGGGAEEGLKGGHGGVEHL
jgi:hypothetical protein